VKPPFEWDHFSDQPKVIFDKAFKRRMRMGYLADYLKMAATSAVVLPVAMLHSALFTRRVKRASTDIPAGGQESPALPIDLFGMGVSLEKGAQQVDLINELGVRHILMRVPLWDSERFPEYKAFAEAFCREGKTIVVNILQDREHISDPTLLRKKAHQLFDSLSGSVTEFQIGNAINRMKWGFAAVEEYLQFFKVTQEVRDKSFPPLQLLGPAVIDFEYHFTVRALFNSHAVRFDRLSALLYVDRMGSPDNPQYGIFNADRKIRLLSSLGTLSPKVRQHGIYVTEVNWPLRNTAPYAPTSDKECVSQEDYSRYMSRYHEIAAATGCVDRVYWHQLIAPGYGLIDSRHNTINRTPAFYRYRDMVQNAKSEN
jgi:hypothetical protein